MDAAYHEKLRVYNNPDKVIMIEQAHAIIPKMLAAARKGDKKLILELYGISEKMNTDLTDEKWTIRYNKAVDKCNNVLYPI